MQEVAQSIYTVCGYPVQGTIMEKRRRIEMESVDRASRTKCDINLIGGAHLGMGPLARMMRPDDGVAENDCRRYADWST